jgi:dolichyl-phosphate beta-glucosyltransferase|tara:strand:- start:142 stop:870 length:729 start_codon:yes stop_codon:yes gene_type:complete
MKKISIVFPLYNEENRLNKLFYSLINFEKLKTTKFFEFIFVDDGSRDKTKKKILQFLNKIKRGKKRYKFIQSKKNFGKGHALKLGVKYAKHNWILTMDADLSVDLFQIIKWFKNYRFKNNHAYFGSRNHPQSTIKYKYYRKLIGNILQILIFLFIDTKIKDTQCGFKFYNKKYIKKIFRSLKENRFAHDIELVLLLKKQGIKITELPIKWKHVDGSKLNPFSVTISFFLKFFIILTRYKFIL